MAKSFEDLMHEYACVSAHLRGADEVGMCVEVLEYYQGAQAIHLIQKASGLPILVSYSSDGTPVEVAKQISINNVRSQASAAWAYYQ